MENNTIDGGIDQTVSAQRRLFTKNIIRYIGISSIVGFATLLIPGLVARMVGHTFIFSVASFAVLHNVAEGVSITFSFIIAVFGWYAFRESGRRRDLLFAIGFFAIAILDATHTISFPGMPMFITENTVDKSIDLWLAARFIQAGILFASSFLVVPYYFRKKWRATGIMAVLAGLYISAAYYVALYVSPVKQHMFVPGTGLTPLKIGLEYSLIFIVLVAVLNSLRMLKKIEYRGDRKDEWVLMAGMVMFLFSEVAFTLYKSPTDLYNFVGHVLKIGAMIPIYMVFFTGSIRGVFHELTRKRETVDILGQELEQRIVDRTQKIEEVNRLLNIEKNRFQALLESIGDGVVAIDRDWTITVFNDAAVKISGWTKEEALGRPFRSIIKILREQDRKEAISFIEDAMSTGEPRQLEYHAFLVMKNGKEISLGDSAAPILSGEGKVVGAIIVFRDKTAEKNASMLRSDFAYASHQLRTPVTKALWELEAAMGKKTVEEIKAGLSGAYQAIQSMNRLSDELVEVSKLDQQEVRMAKQMIKIADLCADMAEIHEEAKRCGVVLQEPAVSAIEGINTDPRMFKRIMNVVLDNAIKYSDPNGTVKVSMATKDDTLEISVEDFGCGILEEEKPMVFTKFFRGRNIDTTAIAGAGLGLYIAQEYVKLLGGKIWFEPKGKGTIFYITLPIV